MLGHTLLSLSSLAAGEAVFFCSKRTVCFLNVRLDLHPWGPVDGFPQSAKYPVIAPIIWALGPMGHFKHWFLLFSYLSDFLLLTSPFLSSPASPGHSTCLFHLVPLSASSFMPPLTNSRRIQDTLVHLQLSPSLPLSWTGFLSGNPSDFAEKESVLSKATKKTIPFIKHTVCSMFCGWRMAAGGSLLSRGVLATAVSCLSRVSINVCGRPHSPTLISSYTEILFPHFKAVITGYGSVKWSLCDSLAEETVW